MLLLEKEDYWIFKISDPRRNFLIDNVISNEEEYTIQYEVTTIQKRDFNGKVLFLFFDEQLTEWAFEYEGYIKSSEYITHEANDSVHSKYDRKKYFKITFTGIHSLSESYSLDDLKYSIKSIKDFRYPFRNIKNNLNKISEIEYKAITNGEIYYTRTAFYKLFLPLHYDHKTAFYNQVVQLNDKLANIENNMEKLLPLLVDYIKINILKSAKLFVESIEIFKEIVENVDLTKIGFDDVENKVSIHYMLPKYDESKEFISALDKLPNSEEIRKQYSDYRRTESEFYKIFKNDPFPVHLL